MSGSLLRLAGTVATAAALALGTVSIAPGAAVAVPGEPAPAPVGRTVAGMLADLQRLYRDTRRATETYRATEAELAVRRAEAGRLEASLARARLVLYESRGAAGRLARLQYQDSTGVSPYVRLLLARDPQRALDEGRVIGRLARERALAVGRLADSERRADALARRARAALDARLTLSERARKQRDEVRRRLDGVEELLASLSAAQLAALREQGELGGGDMNSAR